MNLTPKQLNVLRFVRKFRDANEYAPTLEEIAREFGVSKITALQHLRALEKRGAIRRSRYQSRSIEISEPARPHAGRRIPLAGTIAAGAPIEAIEEREVLDLSELIRGRPDPFLLRVRGDSMIDEQIREGDYVICERRSTAVNGETVVAILPGGEATLKKFYLEPNGRIRLQPANPKLSPTYADRIEIRGVVVGVLRKY
ncbi:MAG: transcriptional repressor LexA [Candidatus Brocadiia bacterium]